MDKQKCDVCGKAFDFDAGGFGIGVEEFRMHDGRPQGRIRDVLVCSKTCAKKSAASRGSKYAIHDDTDAIVETNVP